MNGDSNIQPNLNRTWRKFIHNKSTSFLSCRWRFFMSTKKPKRTTLQKKLKWKPYKPPKKDMGLNGFTMMCKWANPDLILSRGLTIDGFAIQNIPKRCILSEMRRRPITFNQWNPKYVRILICSLLSGSSAFRGIVFTVRDISKGERIWNKDGF